MGFTLKKFEIRDDKQNLTIKVTVLENGVIVDGVTVALSGDVFADSYRLETTKGYPVDVMTCIYRVLGL